MKPVKEMVAEANAVVDHAPAEELKALHGQDGVTFVDLALPGGKAPPELALSAVWLRDTRNPLREAFVEVLTRNLEALGATA